jgi:hypothetical protein
LLPFKVRHPSRGAVAAAGPISRRQAQAMLPPPPPGPNLGAFAETTELPQDIVGAVVGEFRTSTLDLGTALRVGGWNRPIYFGTVLDSPQQFTAPSQTNSEDSLRAGVAESGNARRALGKNSSRGLRGMPGSVI